MSDIDNGGPAFPTEVGPHGAGIQTGNQQWHAPGMTLRDYFAAKALQGLCANPGGPFQANDRSGWAIVNCTVDHIAQEAYGLADAMLRARAS